MPDEESEIDDVKFGIDETDSLDIGEEDDDWE